MFYKSFRQFRDGAGDEEYLSLIKYAQSEGYSEYDLRRMDMYGFNRIIDGFRKSAAYQKWAPYYESVSDLKRNILTARSVWNDRNCDGTDGCTHCHSPIEGKRYITGDKVLCPLCYSAYRYIRPTLENCADPYSTDIFVYDWKDWPTFLKDNTLDDGWHWEYGCGVLLKLRGFEQRRVWYVRHPAVMRNIISAGIPM